MAHFCKKLQADCRRGWMLALTAMLIVFAPAAFAQSAPTVTGTVTDQSGQPVIGATIIEQGTTNGATTGVDGSYSLKLRGGGNSANLIFQSLGFVSQTVAVNGRTKIDVKLAEDAVALDAVVAVTARSSRRTSRRPFRSSRPTTWPAARSPRPRAPFRAKPPACRSSSPTARPDRAWWSASAALRPSRRATTRSMWSTAFPWAKETTPSLTSLPTKSSRCRC